MTDNQYDHSKQVADEFKLDDVQLDQPDAPVGGGDLKDRARDLSEKAKAASSLLDEKIHALDSMNPKELGDLAVKFATDTAYAAAGLANLVADKARDFGEKQQAKRAGLADVDALAENAKGSEAADKTREFLDNLNAQLSKFVEDLGATYKDLSERGREAIAKVQAQAGAKADAPKRDDAPGMFDIDEAADTAEPTTTIADVHEAADPEADHLDKPKSGFEPTE